MPRQPFSKLCSSLLCAYCSNKLPERGPSKARLCVLLITQLWTIRLRSIKSSLPSLCPLRHSHDKIFQALYRFSVLQATKIWVGPGNEARVSLYMHNYSGVLINDNRGTQQPGVYSEAWLSWRQVSYKV